MTQEIGKVQGYNKPAQWRYKLEGKQNAKGQVYFTITVEGDDEFLMVNKYFKLLNEAEDMAREQGRPLTHDKKEDQVD